MIYPRRRGSGAGSAFHLRRDLFVKASVYIPGGSTTFHLRHPVLFPILPSSEGALVLHTSLHNTSGYNVYDTCDMISYNIQRTHVCWQKTHHHQVCLWSIHKSTLTLSIFDLDANALSLKGTPSIIRSTMSYRVCPRARCRVLSRSVWWYTSCSAKPDHQMERRQT